MISFEQAGQRFHYRAGAVVVVDGHVLLHRLEGDTFWALPGGRVEMGELAQAALVREFQEELGTSVTVGELLSTGENFFAWGGQPHHEVGLYFAAALPPGSPLLDLSRTHLGVEGRKRLEFRWFPHASLAAVDFRPAVLRAALGEARALPRHFVQRD